MAKKKKKFRHNKKKAPPSKWSSLPFSKGDIPWIFGILTFTLLIFIPLRQAEFVYWDDDRNITENDLVMQPLSAKSTKDIFSTPVIGNYNPLSNWSFALEKKLFVDGAKYKNDSGRLKRFSSVVHLDNILLHLANIILLWLLLRAIGFSLVTTGIATLLFALHPMHVESVAWATERKDVLYSFFFLGSALTYTLHKYHKRPKWWWYLSLVLFFIGLFAKIQMVSLPLTLLVIDYYIGKLRDLREMQVVLSKWLYFLLAFLFGVLGIYFLSSQGSLETNTTFNAFQRLFIGTYSLTVYLIKSIYPYELSALYPYPASLTLWHYLSVLPFIGFIVLLWYSYKKEHRILFFGLSWFLVNILFLLQFFGAGQGYIADRFSYISYIGLFVIIGYFASVLLRRKEQWRWPLLGGMVLWLVFLIWTTHRQIPVWQNTESLFTKTIALYPKTMTPYRNRGNYYRDNGITQKALEDYSKGLALRPEAEMYNSRAKLFFSKNQIEKAISDYKNAIKLDPKNGEYLINLGATYAKAQQFYKALDAINRGLKLSPGNQNAYLNRSIIYLMRGEYNKQIEDLKAYLKNSPNSPDIWYEMGRAYMNIRQFPKALEAFNKALQYNKKGEYYHERAKVHASLGQLDRAKHDAKNAQNLGIAIHPQLKALLNQ